jgi:hypothetical protein
MPKWQSWGPCLVVVGWVWAVTSEAVKETAAVDAVTVYHDSGGIHPQCTQGPSDYIHNWCVPGACMIVITACGAVPVAVHGMQ